jgi:E1A/CREB-binding protein
LALVANLPYFEGDYWVGEIEAIIEACEAADGEAGKAPWKPPEPVARPDSLISRKKAQMAPAAARLATRSSQGEKDDEGARAADPVMARLREIFEPMKNSFFVASLQDGDSNDAPAPFAVNASLPMPAAAPSVAEPAADGADEGSVGGDGAPFSTSSASASPSAAPLPEALPVALSVVGAGGVRRALRADPDAVLESDLCDSRQSFLNACQAQHLQFDQLRRAKHSTALLCYALHHPAAPLASAADAAQAAAPDDEGAAGGGGGDTAERRAARQQSIQLHMKLLLHTSSCLAAPCPSQNCRKMKSLLNHSKECTARSNKQVCQICRRVYALLHIHARDCRDEQCAVLHCRNFRERSRQTRRQQNQVTLPSSSSSPASFAHPATTRPHARALLCLHLMPSLCPGQQMDMRRRAAMNASRRQAMED